MTEEIVRKLVDGVWETGLEQDSGGGSQPTDSIFTFAESPGAGPLLPIVDLVPVMSEDEVPVQIGAVFTVDGDYLAYFPDAGPFEIVGSTGNDADDYQAGAASYDSNADTTSFTAYGATDPTVDGSIQAASLYTAQVVLPPLSAVEWVFVETLEGDEWDSGPSAYLWAGDTVDESPSSVSRFLGGLQVKPNGRWQWPLATVSASAVPSSGASSEIQVYPDGTTINVFILAQDAGGSNGRTTVIVHHHQTEAAVAAVKQD